MKLEKKTTATLLIALFMISAFAFAVSAEVGDMISLELQSYTDDGFAIAEFVSGTSDIHLKVVQGTKKGDGKAKIRVTIDSMKLGDLQTISWDVLVKGGYRPHVDIYLNTDDDDERDTCLVVEYAYANGDAITSTLDTWLSTFEGGSGEYPSWSGLSGSVSDLTTINGETCVWENFAGQVPLECTLADFQTEIGIESAVGVINKDTPVLYFDIEIDDWALGFTPADAEAYVKNIRLNGVQAPTSGSVTMSVEVIPTTVSISVTPSSFDFGPVLAGETTSTSVNILNDGTAWKETITVELLSDTNDFYKTNLQVGGKDWDYSLWTLPIAKGMEKPVTLSLSVPQFYLPGEYAGTLVFWAEETPK